MRIARAAACILTVVACAEPGNKDEHLSGGAVVYLQRPDDSSTKITVDYRGLNGRAIENYYALSDVVRLSYA